MKLQALAGLSLLALTLTACSYFDDDEGNDAPTISSVAKQTVLVDNSSEAISFSVGDDHDSADSLQISASSSDPVLLPAAGILLGGSAATRTIMLTPAEDQSGMATITLQVKDHKGKQASTQFVLEVLRTQGASATARAVYVAPENGAPLKINHADLSLDNEDPHAFDDLLAAP